MHSQNFGSQKNENDKRMTVEPERGVQLKAKNNHG
jgi:hypothetical protein